MSAYLCDGRTINAIATYAADHGIVQDPALFADLLTCMNVLALRTRYRGRDWLPEAVAPAKVYRFERAEECAARVSQLAAEYDYQAAEVADYDLSLCARLVSKIILHAAALAELERPGGVGAQRLGVYWTERSANRKTGPIPVSTTSAETCPAACPLQVGCYAKGGNVGILWHALTRHGPNAAWKHGRSVARSIDWTGLCERVAGLPEGTLWRHNQAGDLPHVGQRISATRFRALVRANKGRRGFTYTHHLMGAWNRALIRWANAQGFTVNLSGNNLEHADRLAETGAGPVVVILPAGDAPREARTPAGRVVRTCPATYAEEVTCKRCRWCAMPARSWIVGFPAHGSGARAAGAIARGRASIENEAGAAFGEIALK